MQREDMVPAMEEDSPLAEVKLPRVTKRVVVRRLQDKARGKVTLEEEYHTNVEEVMVEAKKIPISVTSVTNVDTGHLNVLKMSTLDKGELMLLNLM